MVEWQPRPIFSSSDFNSEQTEPYSRGIRKGVQGIAHESSFVPDLDLNNLRVDEAQLLASSMSFGLPINELDYNDKSCAS